MSTEVKVPRQCVLEIQPNAVNCGDGIAVFVYGDAIEAKLTAVQIDALIVGLHLGVLAIFRAVDCIRQRLSRSVTVPVIAPACENAGTAAAITGRL